MAEMTIVPATVSKIVPDATPEEEWQWAVDGERGLRAFGSGRRSVRHRAAHGFETYFINRATGHGSRGSGRTQLRRVPRCLHINIEEEDLYEAIRSTKGRLTDFHVAENNRGRRAWVITTGRRSSKPSPASGTTVL